MTIKELAAVMANETTYCVLIGPDQEIIIAEEDKALMDAFGDVLIDCIRVSETNRLSIYAAYDLRREQA